MNSSNISPLIEYYKWLGIPTRLSNRSLIIFNLKFSGNNFQKELRLVYPSFLKIENYKLKIENCQVMSIHQLVQKHQYYLVQKANHIAPNKLEAEDLVQDAILRIIEQ